MPGMGARERGPVDNEKFYKLLGVERSASQRDIKKAYRKAAMIHHPDKGGDEEKFKEITKAYEALGDEEKRGLYDKYGEEALEGGGGGGGVHPGDIFSELFGGGGGRRRGSGRPQKRRGEDVVFPLKVSLEDLYNGTTKKLRLTKNVICKACNGKGGRGDSVQTCRGCKGHGVRIVVRQLGPGMIQQMQTHCTECNGEGTVIADADMCQTCHGGKTVKERKTLEVYINKGMKHKERIVFRGEADEAPETIPGDVVVVLQEKKHEVFRREGSMLFFQKTITLVEALLGFEFRVTHLDERVLLVKSDPNEVIKPGDVKAIRDEGMPEHKNPYNRGNMYVEFKIKFPEKSELGPKASEWLPKVLPPAEEKNAMDNLPDEYEEFVLEDVDIDAERRRFEQAHKEAYEEDDEHHRGAHQARCAQS